MNDVVCFFLKPNSRYLCMMYDIIRSDERCDRAYWGRTMRGAQNGCNELPARRSNRTSRVKKIEVCPHTPHIQYTHKHTRVSPRHGTATSRRRRVDPFQNEVYS